MSIHWGGRGPGHMGRNGKAAGAAFNPASLFTGGEAGGFWVASSAHTWADASATTPITDNTKIARIDDISGLGNHLLQATVAKQLTWKANGGSPYALSAFGDTTMAAAFTIVQPFDRIDALRVNTHNAGYPLVTSVSPPGQGQLMPRNASDLVLEAGADACTVTYSVGTDYVITERFNGASSRLALDAGSYATGNPGANGLGGYGLGYPGFSADQRFYGAVMINRALTATEIDNCRTYLAALQGRIL